MMDRPLMPKATAVWLVDNTTLSFDQIAEFCGIHPLEVQGVADGDLHTNIVGVDPTKNNTLSMEEIERCQENPDGRLQIKSSANPRPQARTKGPRYTPVARRQEKPDAIAWLIKHHPLLKDAQIIKLIGTTKNTIGAIRDKSHWNMANLEPRDPVLLGLCTQIDLDSAVEKVGGTPGPIVEEPTEGTVNRLAVPDGVFEKLGGLGTQDTSWADSAPSSDFMSEPEGHDKAAEPDYSDPASFFKD